MIILNNWFGILGNNIIQLINILHISLYYNLKIKLLLHPYFNTKIINEKLCNDNLNDKVILTDPNDFYYKDKIKNVSKDVFDANYEKIIDILSDVFTIKNVPTLNKNTLVIHIRSGDIFVAHPHPAYLPPPLTYYTNILNNNNFDKVILVAEDTKNPVINALILLYPNIIYKKQSLENDIKTILAGDNIICSVGSFIPYLIIFSKNITNLYKPSYVDIPENYYNKKFKIHNIDLIDYRSKLTTWRNTREQIELLMKYK